MLSIIFLGTLFCSIILSKTFKIHDGVIGSFAAFWSTLQAVSYLFANKTWQLNLSKNKNNLRIYRKI